MHNTKFDQTIENLRKVGELLVPFNWPRNDPALEPEISILKRANVVIDGYDVLVKFNKAEYSDHEDGSDDYMLETLQLTGQNIPFLPFGLVVKAGRRVLGGHQLSLVEFFQDNRKVYCWSVCLDERGRPIPPPFEEDLQRCTYEGFEYAYIESNELSFY